MQPRSLLALGLIDTAAANNGYVASFTEKASLMALKNKMFLDPNDAEIARLADGFTMMLWAKFNDLSPTLFQPPMAIYLLTDGNWLQPFGGVHGGFEFGSNAPVTVKDLGDDAANWHHYAVSWDKTTGNRSHYVDGVQVNSDQAGAGADWLADGAFIVGGMVAGYLVALSVIGIIGIAFLPETLHRSLNAAPEQTRERATA